MIIKCVKVFRSGEKKIIVCSFVLHSSICCQSLLALHLSGIQSGRITCQCRQRGEIFTSQKKILFSGGHDKTIISSYPLMQLNEFHTRLVHRFVLKLNMIKSKLILSVLLSAFKKVSAQGSQVVAFVCWLVSQLIACLVLRSAAALPSPLSST